MGETQRKERGGGNLILNVKPDEIFVIEHMGEVLRIDHGEGNKIVFLNPPRSFQIARQKKDTPKNDGHISTPTNNQTQTPESGEPEHYDPNCPVCQFERECRELETADGKERTTEQAD